jgi:effector-binding domain-containing protein
MTARLSFFYFMSFLLASGCSVFGIRTAEELEYKVIKKEGNFEIRQYEPYIKATVTMEGEYDEVQGDLFRALAGYIFGKNEKQDKIAMTAPVMMDSTSEPASEKIAMTAPVMMEGKGQNQWTMAFSIPKGYTMDTLPKPMDQRVQLVEVPGKRYATLRFSGVFGNLEKRKEKAKELILWMENKNYEALSAPRYAGYDPPFTLPFLRRNEVLIETKSQQD